MHKHFFALLSVASILHCADCFFHHSRQQEAGDYEIWAELIIVLIFFTFRLWIIIARIHELHRLRFPFLILWASFEIAIRFCILSPWQDVYFDHTTLEYLKTFCCFDSSYAE